MYKLSFRTVFTLLALIILTPLTTSKVLAVEDFKTSYNTLYFIKENGNVRVTQNVTIENRTSKYFVSQYKFTIGSEEPKNIAAWDQDGSLTPQVSREEGKTNIALKFNARIVGKGNKLNFGVSYDFSSLIRKDGLIWELDLLKISGLDKVSAYTLTISVPKSFGPTVFQFPSPASQREEKDRKIISYGKDDLLQGTPRLAFGEFQLYQLSLAYHLRNPSISLGYTEIAIPPDVPGYQQIVQKNLLPAPDSVRTDGDGNYLARYNLGPFEKKEVVWEGYIALFYPQRNFGQEKIDAIPSDLIEKYTGSQKYWETDAVEIKAQAAQITNPKLSVAQNLEKIYDFVTNKLSYDYSKLETGELIRLGALASLDQSDKAVCMEYTDLFVALARTLGVPTREINGYAYTSDETNRPLSLRIQGGDVLHAWPQTYIPSLGWVMVDPTWGSTSGSNYFTAFDLSHLTFVIKGESSEYPLPAGSYKTNPNQKDVQVSFSDETNVINEKPQFDIQVKYPPYAVAPFSVNTAIRVKNTGKTSAFAAVLSVQSSLLSAYPTTFNLGTIPPGAEVIKEITLSPKNALTRGEEKLDVTVQAKDFQGGKLSSKGEGTKIVRPLYFPLGLPELAILIGAVVIITLGKRLLVKKLTK
ncbi:MAG: hypothetical protein BMS9Abin34_410 [Patescibacteria group bacterium]|nr:MAG: hypothetical protein BMS9Abin34_410 [Patescibacteria group bacterium]